jgi:hypothetical protein
MLRKAKWQMQYNCLKTLSIVQLSGTYHLHQLHVLTHAARRTLSIGLSITIV